MATSINLRINDELEKKLKETVEDIKKNTPLGAEVNNSTVVRGALIDFFNKLEEEKKDIQVIKFDLNKISEDKLRKLEKISGELSDLFSCGWEEEIPLVKSTFMLHEAVKYKLFELSKKEE